MRDKSCAQGRGASVSLLQSKDIGVGQKEALGIHVGSGICRLGIETDKRWIMLRRVGGEKLRV